MLSTANVTMTSLELVEFINLQRKEGEAILRHDDFMRKVPKVLGEEAAPKFYGVDIFTNGTGGKRCNSTSPVGGS